MKRFMMFSVGCLCLAVAVLIGFYIGSQQVEAQISDVQYFREEYGSYGRWFAVTPSGDVYYRGPANWNFESGPPFYCGNFWGDMVSTDQSTWSNVKQR